MNPLYNILNYDYIQQQIQTYHINQAYEVQKSAKALQDFLDSVDKLDPNYQQLARQSIARFSQIILENTA